MGRRSTEIGNELMRLLDQQIEFLRLHPHLRNSENTNGGVNALGNCSQSWSSWQKRLKCSVKLNTSEHQP
jgi:hypothetical protein